MTTIKGVMRSINAAANKVEREYQRQNREAVRIFKEQEKIQNIINAEQAVDKWENYISIIQGIHKDCSDNINWKLINKRVKPQEPKLLDSNERNAQISLDTYEPSFFDKFFGRIAAKRKKLEEELSLAKKEDLREYEKALNEYNIAVSDWEEEHKLSEGILNKQLESYVNALERYQPFTDIFELGTKINFSIDIDKEWMDVELHVNGVDIVPNYILALTSTGKLSKKNMSKTRFNEIYQDHVCSAVLRVAREVFALLPLDYVRVNAMANILNQRTGYLEETPILSVIIRPETLRTINFPSVDPSDCMKNFVHNMKFKKTMGFEAVEKVALL